MSSKSKSIAQRVLEGQGALKDKELGKYKLKKKKHSNVFVGVGVIIHWRKIELVSSSPGLIIQRPPALNCGNNMTYLA